MGKTRFLIMGLFVLALAAGLAAGLLLPRAMALRTASAPRRTALAEELGLNDTQSAQMREIWEGVRDRVDACFLRAQQVQKQRDDAILSLLTPEQQARFDRAQREYASKLDGIKAEREAAFKEAVQRTEEVLSGPQKARYRQILASRLGPTAADAASPPDWIPASQPSSPASR